MESQEVTLSRKLYIIVCCFLERISLPEELGPASSQMKHQHPLCSVDLGHRRSLKSAHDLGSH